jgi:hypothetical protein
LRTIKRRDLLKKKEVVIEDMPLRWLSEEDQRKLDDWSEVDIWL